MKKHEKVTLKLLQQNKGNYIQLGGKGILDGLKCQPCKVALLRIENLKTATGKIPDYKKATIDDLFDGVFLHWYRHKRLSVLPSFNFNQTCRIYTPKEFKSFPAF